MIALRDYQSDHRGVEGIRAAFRGGARRVLYVLPCGGGKTVCFSYMTEAAAAKGRRVLLLAHRGELVDQISETLTTFGVEHGRIQAGRSMTRIPIQAGMIGTVANRLDKIAAPDLIVVDECHHSTSKTYRKILDTFPDAFVLGVTATPARTDGRGLVDAGYNAIVIGPTVAELVGAGHLAPYRLFCPPSDIDLSGIKTTAGDYQRSGLSSRLDRPEITGDAVEHYRKYANGTPFVAFCVSVEHAAHVAEQFRGAGIPTRNLDGTMPADERRSILNGLRSGQIAGVASCDLISEGFDLPRITTAILLRPTKSLIIYVQQTGRALRPFDGKDHAIILDHAGNALRHGLPDQGRAWSLEGRGKGARSAHEAGIQIRHCRLCFAVYPGGLDRCPHCNGLAERTGRKIEERDGELIEITAEMELDGKLRCLPYAEALAMCEDATAIRQMAKARGYKPGWAIRQTMHRFGVSPQRAAIMLGYHPGIVSRIAA